MSKPNAKPTTEIPTEWRRIVMEDDGEGNVRPISVESVHQVAEDTKVGVQQPDDATAAQAPAANPLADGAPEEWQDVFRTQSKPVPVQAAAINLQEEAPDFAEKTMAGMSFPEFFEGNIGAVGVQGGSSVAEATQRQEGMWDQSTTSTAQSDAFPFSAPPAPSSSSPSRPALVMPEPDPQADMVAPPAGVLDFPTVTIAEGSTNLFPEKTQSITVEQAKALTEAHQSVRQQMIAQVDGAPYLGPPPGGDLTPSGGQDLPRHPHPPAFSPDDVLESQVTDSSESMEVSQLTSSDALPASSDSMSSAAATPWPPEEDLNTALHKDERTEAVQHARAETEDLGESTQFALPPTEGGWDGTVKQEEAASIAAELVKDSLEESLEVLEQPSQEELMASDMEEVLVEDPVGDVVALETLEVTSDEPTSPGVQNHELSTDRMGSGTSWQQVLSLQQQVASQMAEVVEAMHAQTNSPVRSLLQELLLFFDFVEFRIASIQQQSHEDDPRVLELYSVQSRLLDLFAEHGLAPLSMEEIDLDPSCYRVMDEVETARPEEDGMVSRVLRLGFRWNDEIFRPAEVEIRRYPA